jgi:hypothetical protein
MDITEILSIVASILSIISFLISKSNQREIKKMQKQIIKSKEMNDNNIFQTGGNVNINLSKSDE